MNKTKSQFKIKLKWISFVVKRGVISEICIYKLIGGFIVWTVDFIDIFGEKNSILLFLLFIIKVWRCDDWVKLKWNK